MRQQDELDCGAAALAAVLSHHGVPTTQLEIRRALHEPDSRGLRAGDLRDYARRSGFEAFLVHGSDSDLELELDRGRPVMVGTMKPIVARNALAHYEVVVGMSDSSVVTMDPALGWRRYSRKAFRVEWQLAKRLTLIVIPAAPPASAGTRSSTARLNERARFGNVTLTLGVPPRQVRERASPFENRAP